MDLSLVSMEDIWDELKKRHDAIIMVDMKTLDGERESSQISYKGGQFTCVGLLEKAKAKLLKDMLESSTMHGEA